MLEASNQASLSEIQTVANADLTERTDTGISPWKSTLSHQILASPVRSRIPSYHLTGHTEAAGQGTDTVRTALTAYTLSAANVENLTYTGAAAFAGTGNTLANAITGGAGADTLTGGAGADTLDGGDGIDAVSYAAMTAGLTLNLATPAANTGDAQGDVLLNVELIVATTLADSLTGDGGNNWFQAGTGNDTLQGGGGADTLDGGAGTDTVTYTNSTTGVTANLATGAGGGNWWEESSGDVLTGIENLTGSTYDDMLTGSSGTNVLDGSAGDDTLAGGAGNDTLTGGAGNDVYFFNLGDGQDGLTDASGDDTLLLGAGLNASAASYERSGNDLVIKFAGLTDQITDTAPLMK